MATVVRRKLDDTRVAPSADRYRGRAVLDDDDDDDDDDDEESPRAKRRAARDEEPKPSRRASVDDDDDDEPPAKRRTALDDDDDDDDDDPLPRAKSSGAGGWTSWNQKRSALGSYANELRVPDDGSQLLIKFLDDEPFAVYALHWLQLPQGRRSFTCLDDGCPLCDKLGDSPKAMAAFNVLVLDETAEPKLMVWAASSGIVQQIETRSKAKTGPLTKEYYAVSKSKAGARSKGPVQYAIDPVRSRDLREEWGITPLTEKVLDQHAEKAYTEEKFVKRATRTELKAVVREAMDDDD